MMKVLRPKQPYPPALFPWPFIMIALLTACAWSGSPVAPTECSWTWSSGAAPSDFVAQVQQALEQAHILAHVEASTFGERSSCDGYHPMAMDFQVAVQVTDLTDEAALAEVAAEVQAVIEAQMLSSPVRNLGKVVIQFAAGEQSCFWRAEEQRCEFE